MKNDKTIDQMIRELEAKIAWFDSEDFSLDEAKAHFQELAELAEQIEQTLDNLQNEIELIGKKFVK